MKLACVALEVIPGDISGNLKKMLEAIHLAKELDCRIIAFPEMSLSGYWVGDTWDRAPFVALLQSAHETLRESSSETLAILFGSLGMVPQMRNEDGSPLKVSAAYVTHGKRWCSHPYFKTHFWPKTLSPNYGEFEDSRYFLDARKWAFNESVTLDQVLFPLTLSFEDMGAVSIGLTVCEDLWTDQYQISPLQILAAKGVDFFVNLSASPFHKHKFEDRKKLLTKRSYEFQKPIAYVNCTGLQNNGKTLYTFDGRCSVFLPNGKSWSQIPFDSGLGAFQWNGDLTSGDGWSPLTLPHSHKPQDTAPFQEILKSEDNIPLVAQSLEKGLKWLMERTHLKKIVLGLSGGIDSAVSACLWRRVLAKPEDLILVNMPTSFNSLLTQNAAKELALHLGCPYVVSGLEEVLMAQRELLRRSLSQLSFGQVSGLVDQNLQARERGAGVLAALASAVGAGISCNANKSELTVGYGTLYGDLAGFVAPMADLWKGDVYALGRYYQRLGLEIPEFIFNVKPSAELSSDQDITQGKGDPLCYPYHDALFARWVEGTPPGTYVHDLTQFREGSLAPNLGLDSLWLQQLFPTEELFLSDLKRWWKLYTGLAIWKRYQSPPLLAVSRRPFGSSLREVQLFGEDLS
jgi:NAD+ synthase (glutamine-hydrolysing)